MAPHKRLSQVYNRSGEGIQDGKRYTNIAKVDPQPFIIPQTSYPKFPKPSVFQRAQLVGIPYRPSDFGFIVSAIFMIGWNLLRMHIVELPYLIATRFKKPSRQYHPSWPWAVALIISLMRSAALRVRCISHVRLAGVVIIVPLMLHMILRRHIKITKASFKVKLDALLRPERATLSAAREELAKHLPGGKLDPSNPPESYFKSFHPRSTGPRAKVANMPEEVGHIDEDGTYTLSGEWIEVLDDPRNPRPRSNVVCMYFHGGGHTFLDPRSHRSWVARLMEKFGPGARAFVVDYRQAPEHPFPAAIHDAFAAYLYLTEPDHEALILNEDSCTHELAVDPRDIFVAGDSAGGNLTVAFNLYMNMYVQPSTDPKFDIPFASVAISPWSDMGSTVPAMNAVDWHCYCPGPIGSSPFDKQAFMDFKKNNQFPVNVARNYLCGDTTLVPNQRNGYGKEQCWKWYSALAQHPLTSFGHRGKLDNMPDYLFHTATYDRLVDDVRLVAHRVGLANPNKIVRMELYKDTVHVHQAIEHLDQTIHATNNIVRFVLRVLHAREERERLLVKKTGGSPRSLDGMNGDSNNVSSRSSSSRAATRTSLLRKIKVDMAARNDPTHHLVGAEAAESHEVVYTSDTYPKDQPLPLAPFLLPSMVKEKYDDNVEWVVVDNDGRETARDEGWPVTVLKNCWPPEED